MSDIDSDAPAPDSRPAQQGARHESDHSGLDTDSVSTERNRLTATDAAPSVDRRWLQSAGSCLWTTSNFRSLGLAGGRAWGPRPRRTGKRAVRGIPPACGGGMAAASQASSGQQRCPCQPSPENRCHLDVRLFTTWQGSCGNVYMLTLSWLCKRHANLGLDGRVRKEGCAHCCRASCTHFLPGLPDPRLTLLPADMQAPGSRGYEAVQSGRVCPWGPSRTPRRVCGCANACPGLRLQHLCPPYACHLPPPPRPQARPQVSTCHPYPGGAIVDLLLFPVSQEWTQPNTKAHPTLPVVQGAGCWVRLGAAVSLCCHPGALNSGNHVKRLVLRGMSDSDTRQLVQAGGPVRTPLSCC